MKFKGLIIGLLVACFSVPAFAQETPTVTPSDSTEIAREIQLINDSTADDVLRITLLLNPSLLIKLLDHPSLLELERELPTTTTDSSLRRTNFDQMEKKISLEIDSIERERWSKMME